MSEQTNNEQPSDGPVQYSERDGVALIVLDDGKANALSHDLLDQLDAALDRAENASAIVIAGRPGKFCAGFDLSVVQLGRAEASALMPFRYARLVLSLAIAVVVFAEHPDAMTLAGAAVILCAAFYTYLRERKIALTSQAA